MNQAGSTISSVGVCASIVERQGARRLSLSFIIPVYNDQANIARCVRSITALHGFGPDDEVIILDNGSTDGTHQILQRILP